MKLTLDIKTEAGKQLLRDIKSYWQHLNTHMGSLTASPDKQQVLLVANREFYKESFHLEPLDTTPYSDRDDSVISLIKQAVDLGDLSVVKYNHLDNNCTCLVAQFLDYVSSPTKRRDKHLAYHESIKDIGQYVNDHDWFLYFRRLVKDGQINVVYDGKKKHLDRNKPHYPTDWSIVQGTSLDNINVAALTWLNKEGDAQWGVKRTFHVYAHTVGLANNEINIHLGNCAEAYYNSATPVSQR